MKALLFIHDGRDLYSARTLLSALKHLPKFDHIVEVDDRDHRLGFNGAVHQGWKEIARLGSAIEWVFHLECDFTFHEAVPVDRMVSLMNRQPHLAQVSLKRQAWNERERAAGGIVEADPEDFTLQSDGLSFWTEHRRYFTTNPSIYRAELCQRGWPLVPHSEGVFTHQLLSDPELRFALWGKPFDAPICTHIGDGRQGVGY